MSLQDTKNNIFNTHKGIKKDFDENKLDEMIDLLSTSIEVYDKFYDISRKAIFRKSRAIKNIEVGACMSSIKKELEEIKEELNQDV
jgi:hypothetical protein